MPPHLFEFQWFYILTQQNAIGVDGTEAEHLS